MIYVASYAEQENREQIQVCDLKRFSSEPVVVEGCKKFRETGKVIDKRKLPVILTEGRLFCVDVDGKNHPNGNKDIDVEKAAALIPHRAFYKSPSGQGLKFLVEINRDCSADERPAIELCLREKVEELTGLKVCEDARMDIAFVSDYEVKYSDGIFVIPDNLDAYAESALPATSTFPHNPNLYMLDEILQLLPTEMKESTIFSIVMAALNLFGEQAIPLLEEKWKPMYDNYYANRLRYADEYNADILHVLWANRIRRNVTPKSKKYSRRVLTGATGAGKSQKVVEEVKGVDGKNEYAVYAASNVKQAIEFGGKLEKSNISYEILVSDQTFNALNSADRQRVCTVSCNKVTVKIIQLASLKRGSYWKHVKTDQRRFAHLYIDELVIQDIIRPSLSTTAMVRKKLGCKVNLDVGSIYDEDYSKHDYEYARKLALNDDDSNFISSILYQNVDTTVLSTEELTVTCLTELRFDKLTIKEAETAQLKNKCKLHMATDRDFIKGYVDSIDFKKLIDEMKFENVFANNCEHATRNLVVIKGEHIVGKNLSVIRCLPREVEKEVDYLFSNCFKESELNALTLYYKDLLMQSVGRSIGFRGEKEAWVMVHSKVAALLENVKFSDTCIYTVEPWDVSIDRVLRTELQVKREMNKDLVSKKDREKSERLREERSNRIRQRIMVTDNPEDRLTKDDIKNILGEGYTLTFVASVLGLELKNCNSNRFIPYARRRLH